MAIWVVAHMLGNLKALEGPGHGTPAIDAYGRFLRRAGSPVLPHNMLLWIERIVLLSVIVLHMTAVTQLWLRNRRAKPPAHQATRYRSTLSSRSMKTSGVVVLGFLIFPHPSLHAPGRASLPADRRGTSTPTPMAPSTSGGWS